MSEQCGPVLSPSAPRRRLDRPSDHDAERSVAPFGKDRQHHRPGGEGQARQHGGRTRGHPEEVDEDSTAARLILIERRGNHFRALERTHRFTDGRAASEGKDIARLALPAQKAIDEAVLERTVKHPDATARGVTAKAGEEFEVSNVRRDDEQPLPARRQAFDVAPQFADLGGHGDVSERDPRRDPRAPAPKT